MLMRDNMDLYYIRIGDFTLLSLKSNAIDPFTEGVSHPNTWSHKA